MSCRVVVGGQFGSEGKGKVVAHYALKSSEPLVVRCGGPNSGHTIQLHGIERVLRSVPAGVVNPDAVLLLAAGCAVNEAVFRSEIDALGLSADRVVVDPRAVLISEDDIEIEQSDIAAIASTASGVGAALCRRIRRRPGALVGDSPSFISRFRVQSVADLLHRQLERGGDVIIEGTQGFGLSLLHGAAYPYLTARDTTAAAFASEAGVSPLDVTDVTMVIRTFPIRVGGNSGPLDNEISWAEIARRSGAPREVPEFTSVTRRLRRVGEFDLGEVQRATRYNKPSSLAVMGLDRLDFVNRGVDRPESLSGDAMAFVSSLEEATGVPVELVGTGFRTDEVIEFGVHSPGEHARNATHASALA